MCGIAGLLESAPPERRRETPARMTESLRHRGPDEEGWHRGADVALGGRRDHREVPWALLMLDAWRERDLPRDTWR
jgi:hypothetical protein